MPALQTHRGLEQAEKTLAARMDGRDGLLFAMEAGRVAFLTGGHDDSMAAFNQAIAKIKAQEDRAVISATGAGNQVMAVAVNDKAIPYYAPAYEKTMVHHYQALNYLAKKDLTGAGVEVRLANQVQETAREQHDRESTNAGGKADAADAAYTAKIYAGLNELAGSVKASYQNAATFYISAVIREMMDEANGAYIDYKKALEIHPENPYLQQDVIRLGRRLDMREDLQAFTARFPAAAARPEIQKNSARLVVVYEDGTAPQKSALSLPYPLSDGIGMLSIPMYETLPPQAVPLTVAVNGRTAGATAPVGDIAGLAVRALQERMGGIITRQVARSVAKGVATKQAGDAGGDWAAFLMSLYNIFSEQADLRSWLTLPSAIQAMSVWHPAGECTVDVTSPLGGTILSQPVMLLAGKTTLIHLSRIGSAWYIGIYPPM